MTRAVVFAASPWRVERHGAAALALAGLGLLIGVSASPSSARAVDLGYPPSGYGAYPGGHGRDEGHYRDPREDSYAPRGNRDDAAPPRPWPGSPTGSASVWSGGGWDYPVPYGPPAGGRVDLERAAPPSRWDDYRHRAREDWWRERVPPAPESGAWGYSPWEPKGERPWARQEWGRGERRSERPAEAPWQEPTPWQPPPIPALPQPYAPTAPYGGYGRDPSGGGGFSYPDLP